MKRRLVVLLSFGLILFALAPSVLARPGNGNGLMSHISPERRGCHPSTPTPWDRQFSSPRRPDELQAHCCEYR